MEQGIERIFPDIILEFLQKNEWTEVETGITQRLRLIFLGDIYNEQLIVKKVSFQQH
jgi:uncharacterized circularly permuted ATP-grasp superfamily protein